MKKLQLLIIWGTLMLLSTASCTMQKRVYSKGYYVEWNQHYSNEKEENKQFQGREVRSTSKEDETHKQGNFLSEVSQEKKSKSVLSGEISLSNLNKSQNSASENGRHYPYVSNFKTKNTKNSNLAKSQHLSSNIKSIEQIPIARQTTDPKSKKDYNPRVEKFGLASFVLAIVGLVVGILTVSLFLPVLVGPGIYFLVLVLALLISALILALVSRRRVKESEHNIPSAWLGEVSLMILIGSVVILLAIPFFGQVVTVLGIVSSIATIAAGIFLILAFVKLITWVFGR